MSSANLVSVIYVPETVYGVPDEPLSGVTAETTRFTSETLSGTPETTESVNIRTDRMSSGQVVTGLTVGGDLNVELAAGKFYEDFFEAGMMSTWVAQASVATTVTLTPLTTFTATLTITDDFSAIGDGVAVNDLLQLIPATGSPIEVSVISVDSTTECTVATARDEPAIVGASMTVAVPEHVNIDSKVSSFTISKAYEDVLHDQTVDEHSQKYPGSLVSGFNVNATYGEIVTGSYSTVGNGYIQEEPSMQQQIVTAGGTINPAPTTQSLNGSVDVTLVTSNGETAEVCIESWDLTLDNGLEPSTCLGYPAPKNYTLGTAAITVNLSAYLNDESYDLWMAAKLTQDPVSMSFSCKNSDGGFSFYTPALQLSFPDPSSDGQNEQTMLDASGVAKVGENGESSLTIYKLVGEQ